MRVAVVGAGVMGTGIAQLLATHGHAVLLVSRTEESAHTGARRIRSVLDGLVLRNKLESEPAETIWGRIAVHSHLDDVAEAEFVIEAVPEQPDLKRAVLARLDALVDPPVVLASNTSTLPITMLAAGTRHPERVMGMHFFNPAPVMVGIELIPGRMTTDATLEATRTLSLQLGKKPVVAQDYAGFITSRLTNLYLNEAVRAVMDGNTPEDVDNAMLHCLKMPMGPCALMDLVGLDVVLLCLESLQTEFGDRFLPAPLLRQMVRAGHLGRKSGQGFYPYPG
ncbi:MAG TPA: 3-hydroxyacyl-CoA dehydrogenase family protein [Candidatus Xenobia bacterium]|jgi:3-hydroxybutyryl-CoA dehydrogenase